MLVPLASRINVDRLYSRCRCELLDLPLAVLQSSDLPICNHPVLARA